MLNTILGHSLPSPVLTSVLKSITLKTQHQTVCPTCVSVYQRS